MYLCDLMNVLVWIIKVYLDHSHFTLLLIQVTNRPAHEELDTTNMPYKEAGNKSWAIYIKNNNSIIVDLFQVRTTTASL